MKQAQKNNLEHLYTLYDRYKLSLAAFSKIKFLENYKKILESEVSQLENKVIENLKLIKRKERFGFFERFIKGNFDIDATLRQLSAEITQANHEINLKQKEIRLATYEISVLKDIYTNKEKTKQEFFDYFETLLYEYIPENLADQGVIIQFRNQIENLESKKFQMQQQATQVSEAKKTLVDLHSLYISIAYGYQDQDTPKYNILTGGHIKKLRRLSSDFLEIFPKIKDIHTNRSLKIMTIGEDNLLAAFSELSKFSHIIYIQSLKIRKFDNIITNCKIKINEDYKSLIKDLELMDEKIINLKEENRKYFKKILKLDY